MQVTWIEAFLAVVDHRGFAAASTQLYRSQGRVSSYVSSLESELGVQLFDRRQRPTNLTAEGQAFLPYARQVLATLDSGRSAALAVQSLARGDVALATYPSASSEHSPQVLVRFSARYPNIQVQLVERSIYGLDRALDGDEAMLAIRPSVPPLTTRAALHYVPLWRERMFVVAPAGHYLAAQATVTPADLDGVALVFGGQNTRDAELTRLLAAFDVTPRIRYLSDQPQTVVALARQGLAVGVLNDLALRSIRLDGVVVIPLPPGLTREVGAYSTPTADNSVAASALLEVIGLTPPPAGTTDIRPTRHLSESRIDSPR